MRLNVASVARVETHEGGTAQQVSPLAELRRSVLTCLLWESDFYESGEDVAARIARLVAMVEPEPVAALAIAAREQMQLRHVPLLLVRELARRKGCGTLVADTLARVIQRADELTEYLAIYWKSCATNDPNAEPLSAGSKRGLARAFAKFDAYQLAKYDRPGQFRLRDVLRLTHAKAQTPEKAALWGQLIKGELPAPDTWEVALSSGKDKRETWERLIAEKKLGGLAMLRNLRNMLKADIPLPAIRAGLAAANFSRVLPFRFVTAARYAPQLEPALETAMLRALPDPKPSLPGRTILLVDVSGSMDDPLSAKSETTRMDAACGLAIYLREVSGDNCAVVTFSERLVAVPARRGFALRDAITGSQEHHGTYLAAALRALREVEADRIVVITDEQSHDGSIACWLPRGYVVNISTNRHGVSYGNGWTHIDGWSEKVVDFIAEWERSTLH